MKVYSEAYTADGQQILGNMDGQCVIRARNYKRTDAYKRLTNLPAKKLSLNGKVKTYKIVNEQGDVLETIEKIRR